MKSMQRIMDDLKNLAERLIVFALVRPPSPTARPTYRHDPIRERLAGLESQRASTVVILPRPVLVTSTGSVLALRQRLDNSEQQATAVTVAIPANRVHMQRLAS
jgi:hypothetical protein